MPLEQVNAEPMSRNTDLTVGLAPVCPEEKKMERREAHGQRSVMGLVIRRLYFGKATRQEIGMNGRILRDLNTRYDWETLAQMVEGLAIRRDRGELGIRCTDPVSLRWVIDRDQLLNQVTVCLDATYRELPKPKDEKRGGIVNMSSILSQYAKGA
jgi:hypothetical protein